MRSDFGSPPLRGNNASFGVGPEIDTSLGPTRFVIDSSFHRFTDVRWFSTNRLLFHINSTSGPTFTLSYAAAHTFADLDQFNHSGNLQAYVGFRKTGYVLGDAVRSGFSARMGGGSSIDADTQGMSAADNINELNQLANLTPFETQRFGFDRPLTFTSEYRLEMIGCHAPFVHLRFDVTLWRATRVDNDNKEFVLTHAVPFELAFGGYVAPRFGVSFHTGIEFRGPRAILEFGHFTRVGGLLDVRVFNHLHLTGRFDGLTGDGIVGWNANLGVYIPFGVRGAFE